MNTIGNNPPNSSYLISPFFRRHVAKRFYDGRIYIGIVAKVLGGGLFKVVYTDFDSEDMTREQLIPFIIAGHPAIIVKEFLPGSINEGLQKYSRSRALLEPSAAQPPFIGKYVVKNLGGFFYIGFVYSRVGHGYRVVYYLQYQHYHCEFATDDELLLSCIAYDGEMFVEGLCPQSIKEYLPDIV